MEINHFRQKFTLKSKIPRASFWRKWFITVENGRHGKDTVSTLDTSVGCVISSASSSTHRPWAQLRGTACSVRLRGSGADLGLKAEALELRGDQAEALRRRRQGHRTRGRRSRSSRGVLLGRRVRRRWVGLQRRRRCRCKRHGGTPERGARRLAWLSALRRQPS